MSQNSNDENEFNKRSPIECYKLNMIAVYCVIILILSIIFNSMLLYVFYCKKKMRTNINKIIIALTLSNLIGSIVEMYFIIPSNFSCKWMFNKIGCYISGFFMYFLGCLQIYLMTAISVERYLVVFKPYYIRKITLRVTYNTIISCVIISLFWTVLPFFGWSYYSLEGGLTSCSVEWADKNWNVYSYNITIFIFIYIIPLILIVYCNLNLLFITKFSSKKAFNRKTQKRIQREKKLTNTILIQICGYLITWTPYAIVSMYSAFINSDHISPLAATLPAMFSKSSMVWSTILFIYSNEYIGRPKFV